MAPIALVILLQRIVFPLRSSGRGAASRHD